MHLFNVFFFFSFKYLICKSHGSNSMHWGIYACRRSRRGRLNLYRLTKIGLEKMFPGLMSLDFCCCIKMARSESYVNNMKAWIHPVFPSRDHAGGGVMVWGIFSWHTLDPLLPIEHWLNATAYLSIVASHARYAFF